jgi:xylan 1,4-beta-xylosidase
MYVDNCDATFQWSYDGKNFYSIGPVLDATHLSDDYYDFYKTGLRFTGTFIVLCCQDVSGRKIPADFEYFIYQKET